MIITRILNILFYKSHFTIHKKNYQCQCLSLPAAYRYIYIRIYSRWVEKAPQILFTLVQLLPQKRKPHVKYGKVRNNWVHKMLSRNRLQIPFLRNEGNVQKKSFKQLPYFPNVTLEIVPNFCEEKFSIDFVYYSTVDFIYFSQIFKICPCVHKNVYGKSDLSLKTFVIWGEQW